MCNGSTRVRVAFTFTCARIDGEVMNASILPYLIRSNAIRLRLWSIIVLLSADVELVASLLVKTN
jgi:hypothetical protein